MVDEFLLVLLDDKSYTFLPLEGAVVDFFIYQGAFGVGRRKFLLSGVHWFFIFLAGFWFWIKKSHLFLRFIHALFFEFFFGVVNAGHFGGDEIHRFLHRVVGLE